VNWSLWSRQILAIARLELRRYVFGRRWVGIYALAAAPVVLIAVAVIRIQAGTDDLTLNSDGLFARFYELFMLRFAIFISCAIVFSQTFRGEVLEKTYHFYLLAPVRRWVLAAGKYASGLIVTVTLFGISTAASHLLLHVPTRRTSFAEFFFQGPGIEHLARYLAVTVLGCIGYGAIFLLIGLLLKNPGIATGVVLAWESFSFLWPPLLQKFTVIHYLKILLPFQISRGVFEVLTEPTSAWIGVPLLLLIAVGSVAVSGWLVRRSQITYSAD
jgi:ABC-type transport system involved in multi-copper enzyme maturation permease subunit